MTLINNRLWPANYPRNISSNPGLVALLRMFQAAEDRINILSAPGAADPESWSAKFEDLVAAANRFFEQADLTVKAISKAAPDDYNFRQDLDEESFIGDCVLALDKVCSGMFAMAEYWLEDETEAFELLADVEGPIAETFEFLKEDYPQFFSDE